MNDEPNDLHVRRRQKIQEDKDFHVIACASESARFIRFWPCGRHDSVPHFRCGIRKEDHSRITRAGFWLHPHSVARPFCLIIFTTYAGICLQKTQGKTGLEIMDT